MSCFLYAQTAIGNTVSGSSGALGDGDSLCDIMSDFLGDGAGEFPDGLVNDFLGG